MLDWYRRLIALRRELKGDLELLDAGEDIVAFRRGEHVIALNLGERSQPPPTARDLILATPGAMLGELPPGGALVALA
jgi:alpha-glucosidase